MKKSNVWATLFTVLYLSNLGLALVFYSFNTLSGFILAQVFMTIFLFQSFILLHEYAHQSMFTSRNLNHMFGWIAGFFTFIPYPNWKFIHKLHHRWTGWREKDPTQENVFLHLLKPKQIKIIDFCWKYNIPIFGLGYRIGNYWTKDKRLRHLSSEEFKLTQWAIILHLVLYVIFVIFYFDLLIFFIPAGILSFMFTDQITLSQHSHIPGNTSTDGSQQPVPVSQQTVFTRTILIQPIIAKYIFYNMNLHKEHHAHPSLPCYYLDRISLNEKSHTTPFFKWLKKSRGISGSELIFTSQPNCDF